MSELVIFKDPAIYPDSTYRDGRGFSGMGGSTFEPQFKEETLKDEQSTSSLDVRLANQHKLGGGFFLGTYNGKGRSAFAITLGLPVVGMDLTFPITKRGYLTLGGSLFGGGQVILQHVVLESHQTGITLGINARLMHHWIYDNTDSHFFEIGPDQQEGIFSIGIRSLLVNREKPVSYRDSEVSSFSIFVGYIPEYIAFHITGSMNIGGFKRRKDRKGH